MANMLYNGVELPDINEVWDKETHPYAGIGSFGVNWMFAALDFEVYADVSKSGYYASSAGKIDQYLCQNGEWVLVSSQNMDAGNLLTSFSQVTFTWASFNILDNNGSVYLAASDPVDPNAPAEPTYTYDKTAFLSGMAMGLCGKGDPTFTGGTDAFTKGYLTGAELRRKRVIPDGIAVVTDSCATEIYNNTTISATIACQPGDLVVGLDHSDASSVNFYIPAEIYATETSLIAGALTIHGIDKFY